MRYPTQGACHSNEESQPFYVNAPYGIMFVHNGNLTNAEPLKQELYDSNRRHINTTSDSEVLLNVFADELARLTVNARVTPEIIFNAVRGVHKRVNGAYACVALIAGKGMLAFRDPYGIRPLCFGTKEESWGRSIFLLLLSLVCSILKNLLLNVMLLQAKRFGLTYKAIYSLNSALKILN